MKLLIVADDYTGALDTGVQFAGWDCTCLVSSRLSDRADVVIIDTNTRHQDAHAAYQTVFDLVGEARILGFTHFYKKIDSVMRGNIGSESKAFMDALNCSDLPVLPAYPENGRTTRLGIQYVNGVPLADSDFGHDPLDPVRHSKILDIIADQADPQGMRVIDAETVEDMLLAAHDLDLHIVAGCAGFAKHLPILLGLDPKTHIDQSVPSDFAVISGSVHAVTLDQLQIAHSVGFPLLTLSDAQKLGDESFSVPAFQNRLILAATDRRGAMLDMADQAIRERIVRLLGLAAAEYAKAGKTIVMIGGDMMRELTSILEFPDIVPILELLPGIVLSQSADRKYTFVSKSGGFGAPDTLLTIDRFLSRQ